MSQALDEHRHYLADELRTSLYRKAIRDVVRPGDVVMDLGAGTGILGLLACEAGARRIYAVDAGGMLQVARESARANGFGDRFVGIQGFSTRIDLPEKVDVIVADQVGYFGFEAGLFESFRDATRRFLKPGGRTIPLSVTLQAAPVSCREGSDIVKFWSTHPGGFDFSSVSKIAANTVYPITAKHLKPLSITADLLTLDVVGAPSAFDAQAMTRVSRAGVIHGLGGWFRARLSPSVTMTNNPVVSRRINRSCAFMPLDEPWRVAKGDRLQIAINVTPQQHLVTWKVRLFDRKGVEKLRATQSSLRGMLMTADAVARTNPRNAPRLTPWGEARRTVIEACDGRKSLAEIECLVFERHRKLFDSQAQAAEFVAKVTAADAAF
ncbi:MAG TPA: 50S ribosomal protein L11 methyltransferase [Candidatus Binataceae bacterium]|nr:50S ribosomal protein L11 methyltransferase [Candidatus Binataceae bacterium]